MSTARGSAPDIDPQETKEWLDALGPRGTIVDVLSTLLALLELAKRAGQRRGWSTGTFALYGRPTAKRYKTFLATWKPAGGVIRPASAPSFRSPSAP